MHGNKNIFIVIVIVIVNFQHSSCFTYHQYHIVYIRQYLANTKIDNF